MISSQTVTKQFICSLSWPGRLDGAWHPTWPGGGVCLNKPNTLHALVSRKRSPGPSSRSFLWLQSPQTCCLILWLELAPMAPTWFPDNYLSRPPPRKGPPALPPHIAHNTSSVKDLCAGFLRIIWRTCPVKLLPSRSCFFCLQPEFTSLKYLYTSVNCLWAIYWLVDGFILFFQP